MNFREELTSFGENIVKTNSYVGYLTLCLGQLNYKSVTKS